MISHSERFFPFKQHSGTEKRKPCWFGFFIHLCLVSTAFRKKASRFLFVLLFCSWTHCFPFKFKTKWAGGFRFWRQPLSSHERKMIQTHLRHWPPNFSLEKRELEFTVKNLTLLRLNMKCLIAKAVGIYACLLHPFFVVKLFVFDMSRGMCFEAGIILHFWTSWPFSFLDPAPNSNLRPFEIKV